MSPSLNPYTSPEALANSCYVTYDRQARKHFFAGTQEKVKTPLIIHVHEQIRAFLLNPAFPCHLGRSAVATESYRFGFYKNMDDADCLQGLCRDLFEFVTERPRFKPKFSTFIASFGVPLPRSEVEFEVNLWRMLQNLHDFDARDWNRAVSSDPQHPDFAYSFAGEAFFIVGLHGHSSRISRRFPYPTLVFNAQEQFETLRRLGQFDTAQARIRKVDIDLQGTINPSLTNFGTDSAAKQYSGRLVEVDWICPFRPNNPP